MKRKPAKHQHFTQLATIDWSRNMLRNTFVQPRIPVATDQTDIDVWTEVTKEAFAPFVRRRRILQDRREIFRTELVNLVPILVHPPSADALLDAVRLCRRVIYSDPLGSHAHQIALFAETSQADGRWLSLAASYNPLDANADLADRATQVLSGIDAMVEGCLKSRLQFLFGFAHRLGSGYFPQRGYELGDCIAQWPTGVARSLQNTMRDPIFGLPISQWRNIAAHRSYKRVGPDLFEATYGRRVKKTVLFSYMQLEGIMEWAKMVIVVCRMANVIINLEFMPESRRLGLPPLAVRYDGWLIILCHNLRMVGFSYVGENQSNGKHELTFVDDLNRNLCDAIIHLSQVLPDLVLTSSHDVGMRDRITEVGVGIADIEGRELASASVTVEAAIEFLDHRLSLKQYVDNVHFWFG